MANNLNLPPVLKIIAYTAAVRQQTPRFPYELLVCTKYVADILHTILGRNPPLVQFHQDAPRQQPQPFNQYPIKYPMELYTAQDTLPMLQQLHVVSRNHRQQAPPSDLLPTLLQSPVFTRRLRLDTEWLDHCLPERARRGRTVRNFFDELPEVPQDPLALYGDLFSLFIIAFPTDILLSTWVNTALHRGHAMPVRVINIIEVMYTWLMYKMTHKGIESFLHHRLRAVFQQPTLTYDQYLDRTNAFVFSVWDYASTEYAKMRFTALAHEQLMQHVHCFNCMFSLHSSSITGPCTEGTIDENDRIWYGDRYMPFGPANWRQVDDKVLPEFTESKEFYCKCHRICHSRLALPPAGGLTTFFEQHENKRSLSGIPWRGMTVPSLHVVTLLRLTDRANQWRHVYADAAFGSEELAVFLKINNIDSTMIIKKCTAGSAHFVRSHTFNHNGKNKEHKMELEWNEGFILTREAQDQVVSRHNAQVAALQQQAQQQRPPAPFAAPQHPFIPLVGADMQNLQRYNDPQQPPTPVRIYEGFIQHGRLRHFIYTAPQFDTSHYVTTTRKRAEEPHVHQLPHVPLGTETFTPDAEYSTYFHIVDEGNREQHQLGINDIQFKQYRRAFFVEIVSLAVHNAYRMYTHRPDAMQRALPHLSFQDFQMKLLQDMYNYIAQHTHCTIRPPPPPAQPAPVVHPPVHPVPPIPLPFITLFEELKGDPSKFRAAEVGHHHNNGHILLCTCRGHPLTVYGCKSCSHNQTHMVFCAPCYFAHVLQHANGMIARIPCGIQCNNH